MNGKVRKILGGMSTAGLILAGSLPLLGGTEPNMSTCTRAKTRTKDVKDPASKKKLDKATPEKTTPEKTAPAKDKAAK